ncbi:CidA/LrgA family protein [Ruminobacter amylophilus]|uniref:CidA/LrgA family protein n=1 Tax=Ruminobacter amylophilus TaxID=867 RepID=UPI00386376A7
MIHIKIFRNRTVRFMTAFLKKTLWLAISFLLIYACLFVGKQISSLLPFVFPGSIVGLLILFLCLEFRIIRLDWIMPSGSLFLKYMALLFMPSAIGIITYLNEVYSSMVLIIFNMVSGIALILLVVGRMFQHMSETPEERRKRKLMYKRALRFKKLAKRKLSTLSVQAVAESDSGVAR